MIYRSHNYDITKKGKIIIYIAQIALSNIKKVNMYFKLINYINIFLLDSVIKSFEYIDINNYFINLINNK